MAAPSRSSSSRGRNAPSARSSGSSGSSSGSSGGNQQVMVLGGIGVAVVVVLFLMMSGPDKGDGGKANAPTPAAAKPAPAPVVAPVSSSSKAGKAPAKPAPALNADTLAQLSEGLVKAKALYNEGSAARTAGDHKKAREKQSEAKVVVDQLKLLVSEQADWQMEAEMDGWTQPAEYVALGKTYGEILNLTNLIRKNGGQ